MSSQQLRYWREKNAESAFNRRMRESEEQAPMVVRCAFCDWSFEGAAVDGRAASLEHRKTEHPGNVSMGKRSRRKPGQGQVAVKKPVEKSSPDLAPPAAMSVEVEEGIVERTEGRPARVRRGRAGAWSREEALAALRRYADEHGHPPATSALGPRNGMPSALVVKRLFGGVADAAVLLGFERPTRGTRYGPQQRRAASAKPRVVKTVEGAPVARLRSVTLSDAAARDALLRIADGFRQLADALYPEERPAA